MNISTKNRRSRVIAIISALAMVVSLFAAMTTTAYAGQASAPPTLSGGTGPLPTYSGGTGTKADPYIIAGLPDLQQLQTAVNSGTKYAGVYFAQTAATIDLNGANWTPIGGASPEVQGVPSGNYFAGSYDGRNNSIINLNIAMNSTTNNSGYGLFGYVNGGVISNLKVGSANDGSKIANVSTADSYNSVGGVVGYLYGSVYNVQSAVYIDNENPDSSGVGGVVGTIERLVQTGNTPQTLNIAYASNAKSVIGGSRVGGIVGAVYVHYLSGQTPDAGVYVKESANLSGAQITTVRDSSRAYVGGIAGYNEGTISHCYNQGTFGSQGGNYVGGLAGIVTDFGGAVGNIDNSYSSTPDAGFPTTTTEVKSLYASADNSDNPTITRALWLTNSIGQEGPPTQGWGTWSGIVAAATQGQLDGNADIDPLVTGSTIDVYFGSFSPSTGVTQSYFVAASPYAVLWWQTSAYATWQYTGYGTITPIPVTPAPDPANAVFVDGTRTAGTGTGTQTDPFADFGDAVSALSNANPIIVVYGTINLDNPNQPNNISLYGVTTSSDMKVLRGAKFDGPLFSVTNNKATFSDVVIDGNSANRGGIAASELISVGGSGAQVEIGKGAVLQNNLADSGAAVRITAGSVTMDDNIGQSTVSPSIATNEAQGNGGGVAVYGTGSFTLASGSITNNVASAGGGVVVGDKTILSSFTMTGGTISGNTASQGSGVAVEYDYALARFFVIPSNGVPFNLADTVYLVDGAYIGVGATVANINGNLTVQCANPADDLVVARGAVYTLTSDDLDKFAYAGGNWEFYLDDSTNTINLLS